MMEDFRNLSGIYFRHKIESTGKWGNVCFEELPKLKQIEILDKKNISWTISLCEGLANAYTEIVDFLHLKEIDGAIYRWNFSELSLIEQNNYLNDKSKCTTLAILHSTKLKILGEQNNIFRD